MTSLDFQQSYFELFGFPEEFDLDRSVLGERYRQLQQELHPDRFASAPAQERRLAVQYSSHVNQAHDTLNKPLSRALYLLERAGMNQESISSEPVDGGFLIEQMELREKLESLHDLVDPDSVLDHLTKEIAGDIAAHQQEFATSFTAGELHQAASACVKMQYLEKLLLEAEQIESELMDTL